MNVTMWVKEMWLVTILIYVCTISASILLLFISELILKAINNRLQKVELNEQKG